MRIYTKPAARYYELKQAGEVKGAPKEVALFRRAWGKRVKRVLDAACGTGRLAAELARRGYDVVGIDTSENMLGVARGKGSKARFLKADVRTYRARRKFDAVVCGSNTINHLLSDKELLRALRNFRRNLKKGGFLVFDVFPLLGKGYKDRCTRKAHGVSLVVDETVVPQGRVVDWKAVMRVNDHGKRTKFTFGSKLAWRTRREWLELVKQAGFRQARAKKRGIKEFYIAVN
jgi:SAM-dependent methyltransferase